MFVKKLENMNVVDPPFILRNAGFSILKGGEGEYMGWTVNWREDGFATKGIRLRCDSRLSSKIIKEIPFPEDMWNWDIHHQLKTTTIRILSCKIVPQKASKWIDSVTYGTIFPMDFFENPIYITLYDAQGRECEPILCKRIKELIGKHHTAELTEPNVKLWSEIKGLSN